MKLCAGLLLNPILCRKPGFHVNKKTFFPYFWVLFMPVVIGLIAFSVEPVKAYTGLTGTRGELMQTVPEITVWYGTNQSFGFPGLPERQINILGKVSNATTLYYRLNDGSNQFLSIGPDSRRLQNEGDFVIDILDRDLLEGENTIVIIANLGSGDETRKTISVNYTRARQWPENYSVDWEDSTPLQSMVQVVDGVWHITAAGIRTSEIGYDRLIAIGDLGWRDYEVVVPVTMYSMDPAGYAEPSFGPAIGILMRWSGHTDTPVICSQPRCGYMPYGAIGWYRWPYYEEGTPPPARLQIAMNTVESVTDTSGWQLQFGTTYIFKMRVTTQANGLAYYRLKVWPQSMAEPSEWDLSVTGGGDDPTAGSILLLAHHVDAAFGDVEVTDLSVVPAFTAESSDFNTCELDSNLWSQLDPLGNSQFSIHAGLSENAALSITVPAGISHDLLPTANNAARATQTVNDGDFTTEVKFDSGVNALTTNAYTMQGLLLENTAKTRMMRIHIYAQPDGAYLRIQTFEKNDDDTWQTLTWLTEKIGLPGISPISLRLSRYGSRYAVSYKVSNQNWVERINFAFHNKISQLSLFAGNLGGNQAPAHTMLVDYFINAENPLDDDILRNELTVFTLGSGSVIRTPDLPNYACGDQVSISAQPDPLWSFSGWTGAVNSAEETQVLMMTGSQNVTANFTQTEFLLFTQVNGSGSIIVAPEQDSYALGQDVLIQAVPQTGWAFSHWGGDVSGENDVIAVTMTSDKSITAFFVQETYILDIQVSGRGFVSVVPDREVYSYGTTLLLQAIAQPGWQFSHWDGDVSGEADEIQVVMNGSKTVQATFVRSTCEISINVIGSGSIAIEPDQTSYFCGDSVTISAAPAYGWAFSHWEGGLTGSNNPVQVSILSDIVANVVFITHQIYIPITQR